MKTLLHNLNRIHDETFKSEKGTSMLEFAICFPFVVLVFICSIDLGRALNSYFTVTRIVYEGTRYAGQQGALEVGEFKTVSAANSAPGHLRVRSRVDMLLLKYDINPGTLPADYLTTQRIQGTGDRDKVRIALKIPFNPIFPMFSQMLGILGTDATGPYLFVG